MVIRALKKLSVCLYLVMDKTFIFSNFSILVFAIIFFFFFFSVWYYLYFLSFWDLEAGTGFQAVFRSPRLGGDPHSPVVFGQLDQCFKHSPKDAIVQGTGNVSPPIPWAAAGDTQDTPEVLTPRWCWELKPNWTCNLNAVLRPLF